MNSIETFVALNIVNNENLVLNSGYPIIFYWDGESNMRNDFLSSVEFVNIIKENCFTIDSYINSFIKLVYIKEGKSYKTEEIQVQDLFTLSYLYENEFSFRLEYIMTIMKSLYYKFLKKEYQYNEDESDIQNIINIYKSIKEVAKDPSDTTIINYIYSKLLEYKYLSSENTLFLKDFLDNTLKES